MSLELTFPIPINAVLQASLRYAEAEDGHPDMYWCNNIDAACIMQERGKFGSETSKYALTQYRRLGLRYAGKR